MDGTELVARGMELIAKSEWPAVALLTVFWLRRPLANMMGRVNPSRVKGPGFEIWFKHGLDHAEGNIAGKPTRRRPRKTATAVQLSSGQEGVAAFIAPIESGLSIPYDEFYDMLGWDPRPIIERAWMEVELVARELLLKAEPEPKGLPFEEVALRVGVPPGIVSAFQELRALRSGAVFSAHFMPTEEDVHRYETLAATVRDELKKHVPQA